ncbi:MAG: trypsin-like peptidase domain-containing protein [Cyanobacteria bacterium SZAS LIN-5]|nr:trypsin-like peptidase domain-containing protein [Cyanobacteria bacterium SZAS LIN-5]
MRNANRKVLWLGAALMCATFGMIGAALGADDLGTAEGGSGNAPATSGGVIENGSTHVAVIPPGRYEQVDAADRYLIQLCRGTEQCSRLREDLKAFARAYPGQRIQFGQIDLDLHTEYDAKRKSDFAAAKAEFEAKAKAGLQNNLGKSHVDGDTTVTPIAPTFEQRGYFDTCPATGPTAVIFVMKRSDSPDLSEGVICSPQELEGFIQQNANVSASGAVSYATPEAYERAKLADRLDALTKPSMVFVWTTHAGKRSGGVGPGFAVGIDKAGNCEISTVSHVTDEEFAGFEVTMSNGQSYPAKKVLDKREREISILTAAVPAEACKPLKIADEPAKAGSQVFMGTLPLPEHFNPSSARWTRGPSDNIGQVSEVKPFAALPGLDSRYALGQEVVVENIQGYRGDSGNPVVNLNGEVVSMSFVTQQGGGVTLALPARFIKEALDDLHRQ